MSARKILVADLLRGAGGSSTGCERALRALGLEMELVCVNHWATAIETHRLNHPQARHYVQDIATVRPHLIVPEGYLDLLMASPTCTHHSVARGGKPTSDQQRSDPWHIITWLTELRVKRLIIENVWEFRRWGPVDPETRKPIKAREGEYFQAWIDVLHGLGFEPQWRKLNAADYGDATTRQRFILMARSDGRRVCWPAATHAKRPAPGQTLPAGIKPWRPAREIVDWGLKGRSIFARKKPLAAKTLQRIYAGAVKHDWPEPYLVILRNHMGAQSLDGPIPTIATGGGKGGGHIGLAEPILLRSGMHGANGPGLTAPGDPLPTFTTDGGLAVAEPIIVNMKGRSTASSSEAPLPTQTAHAGHLFSAEPIVLPTHTRVEPLFFNGRRGNEATPVSDAPVPTLDTKGGVWLAEPFIATLAHSGSDSCRSKDLEQPIGAVHAGGGAFGIVEPFVLSQASGGAPRAASQPLPTLVTGGQRGSGTALISPYYGSGSGETCRSVEETLPTATAKARFGLIVPVTNGGGGPDPRSTEDQVPTMTTAKGGDFALVMPVTHHDASNRARDVEVDPIPTPTGANRGELAFITACHGERSGQGPRTHSMDGPTPTVAATGHVDLVEGAADELGRYDILFRMLEPHELAAAMGFVGEDRAYAFAGTKTDKVKQIGNAVSVRKMQACVTALLADEVEDLAQRVREAAA